MFDNEILKLKNKIGKQEKILLLDNPINNKKSLSLIEKKVHNLEYEYYPKIIASLLDI